MEFAALISAFVLGLCAGMIGFLVTFVATARRIKAQDEKRAGTPGKQTVEQKMARVKVVTERQLELLQLEAALRSKGQDDINLQQQIIALEDEKFSLLESILADGSDPELTAVNTKGELQKMKLSEYLAHDMHANKPSPPKKVESKSQRLGKFTIIKGGKDDSGNTSH